MQAENNISLDMGNKCVDVSRILKALAHPHRLMILCYLSDGEKTVGEIEQACDASQSAVSQFLNRMRLEGLVHFEKRAQFVYYQIKDPQVKLLIKSLYNIFCKFWAFVNTIAVLAEWSKALRSGRSIFGCVGSNPTGCNLKSLIY